MPLLRFSVTRTPFGRVVATWMSVWSPMTASTFTTLSARSTSGPVGLVSVPAVAPRWPMATMVLIPLALRLAASAFTAARELATWKGSKAVGDTRVGASSLVNPTIPTLTPPNVVEKTTDLDHSGGVLPLASTTFADTYGKFASGISVLRRYAEP